MKPPAPPYPGMRHSIVTGLAMVVAIAGALPALADPPPPSFPLDALVPVGGRPLTLQSGGTVTTGMVRVTDAPSRACSRGWRAAIVPTWLYGETRMSYLPASLDTRTPGLCWSSIATVPAPWQPPPVGRVIPVGPNLVHVLVDGRLQQSNGGVVTVVPQAGLTHACPARSYPQAGGDAWLEPPDPFDGLRRPARYGYCWTPAPPPALAPGGGPPIPRRGPRVTAQ